MTISEQLREAALYSRESVWEMSTAVFDVCCDYRLHLQYMTKMTEIETRTYMLLIAEALK